MDPLSRAIATLTGSEVAQMRPLHGGDLSQVREARLRDGRVVVAKTGPLVAREARMLGAIGATGARAPQVLGVAGEVMILERLEETGATPEGWQALGVALARLHARTGTAFGWAEDYAFGPVAIPNAPLPDWPAFWAQRRLLAAPEALPADLVRRIEALAGRLGDLLPRRPPASLLHGDLWAGNVLFSRRAAYLIDPACYHGDSEVDLAMLHLFGAPGPGFAESYGPLAPGWQDRRAVYQLWPALVHLRLFGAGYRAMVEDRLNRLDA